MADFIIGVLNTIGPLLMFFLIFWVLANDGKYDVSNWPDLISGSKESESSEVNLASYTHFLDNRSIEEKLDANQL